MPTTTSSPLSYFRFLRMVVVRAFSGTWRFYAWMTVLTAIALDGLNA